MTAEISLSQLQQKSVGQAVSCSYPSDPRSLQPLYSSPSENSLNPRGPNKTKSASMQQKVRLIHSYSVLHLLKQSLRHSVLLLHISELLKIHTHQRACSSVPCPSRSCVTCGPVSSYRRLYLTLPGTSSPSLPHPALSSVVQILLRPSVNGPRVMRML